MIGRAFSVIQKLLYYDVVSWVRVSCSKIRDMEKTYVYIYIIIQKSKFFTHVKNVNAEKVFVENKKFCKIGKKKDISSMCHDIFSLDGTFSIIP